MVELDLSQLTPKQAQGIIGKFTDFYGWLFLYFDRFRCECRDICSNFPFLASLALVYTNLRNNDLNRFDDDVTSSQWDLPTSMSAVSTFFWVSHCSFQRASFSDFSFQVQEERLQRNQPAVDGYDYSILGNDDHLDDLAAEAQDRGILKSSYIAALMRDLRSTRHGNHYGD